jgi:hypothetical protein
MIDLKNLNKFYVDDFVKDIFIGTLQEIFYKTPSEFHWDPIEERSRLIITDQFSTDNLTPEVKPTIYIRRRPLGFLHTSIDKFMGGNLMTGTSMYSDLLSGIVELVAVCREGLEACRLAGLVFILLTEFRAEMRALGMHEVSVKSLGEEEPKDVRSTFRIVEVPVTVQYTFGYSWMTQVMDGSVLREMSIGRTTDPVTGEILTKDDMSASTNSITDGSCAPSDIDLGTCPACGGKSRVCVPLT